MTSRAPASGGGSASSGRGGMSDTMVGGYRIGHEIGRGSFAVVFKGHHTKNKSLAAIKVVQRSKLSRKLLENLECEIQILKKLNHPHIVALTDCQKTDKYIHIIMEYCSVSDLSVVIKRRDRLASIHPCMETIVRDYPPPPGGGLNEVLVRHFLKQLTSALQFLRKDGLVHRDVKPQNLLLNPPPAYEATLGEHANMDGSRMVAGLETLPVLKLADFGFARVLPATSMAETLCGSPLYMAPEILRYEKYDATADLWSVGTVLYEMLVGKPPFRAPNHVDLLRKIESRNDRIDFPSNSGSSDLKQLVRALLKRSPVERMSFQELFSHPVITGPIPGIKGVPTAQPVEQPSSPADTPERPQSSFKQRSTDYRAAGVEREARAKEQRPSSPVTRPVAENSELPFARQGPATDAPPRPTDMRRPTSSSSAIPSSPIRAPLRPIHAATAPVREEFAAQRRTGYAMDRVSSRGTDPSPGSSLVQQQNVDRDYQRQKERRPAHRRGGSSRELRNSAEEDYVIVDKQHVQVNAFADEMNLRRNGNIDPPSAAKVLARKLSPGSSPSSSPRTTHAITHQPKGSYGRYLGSSPGSAKSTLARALELANIRLFGVNLSPNHSPPNVYPQFPPYAGPNSLVVVGNTGTVPEEDISALRTIEESASRSDVVYSFAQVKYLQLVPASHAEAPQGLGLVGANSQIDANKVGESNLELTPDAMICTAEECLVLFVKVLSLLSKATDIAHAWWAAASGKSEQLTPARSAASTRMNNVVQWIRERFNEVLEKAEVVQNKIIDAQKDLPPNHPSHPSNHPHSSDVSLGSVGSNFMLTTGVTAEKLMYDRALEMSRTSAVNELVGEDLPGCESAYFTALRLLEAILDRREDDEVSLDDEDVKVIEKFVEHIRQRLVSIQKKLAGLATLSKRSSIHSAHGSPNLNHPPSPAAASPSPSTSLRHHFGQ